MFAIQQEQDTMGGAAGAAELLKNAIPERRQIGHRAQVGRKLCDGVQQVAGGRSQDTGIR
jgi:hypothetical protein